MDSLIGFMMVLGRVEGQGVESEGDRGSVEVGSVCSMCHEFDPGTGKQQTLPPRHARRLAYLQAKAAPKRLEATVRDTSNSSMTLSV